MYYYVYLIKSIKYPEIVYVGYTINIKQRLETHNSGRFLRSLGEAWMDPYIQKIIDHGNWLYAWHSKILIVPNSLRSI